MSRATTLLPTELRNRLPSLYATEKDADPTVWAKFFTPDAQWTWFVTEFDGADSCFGLVIGHEEELGYFSLAELEGLRGPLGLPVERDTSFGPVPLSVVRHRDSHQRG